MAKVISTLFISADGVAEIDPDWHFVRQATRGRAQGGRLAPAAGVAGLVDELRLLVHPVAARKGRRLFDDGDAPYHLRVTATEAFPTGVIRVIHSPAERPAKVGYDEVKDQVPGGE